MSNELTTPAKPTKLLIEKNAKDEITKGRIEDATLLYVQLQDGELALNSETDINLTVQVAVTEDTAKNWKATFPKNGCREVPNEDFAKSYKTAPPYPHEEKQHVLKLKSRGTYQQTTQSGTSKPVIWSRTTPRRVRNSTRYVTVNRWTSPKKSSPPTAPGASSRFVPPTTSLAAFRSSQVCW